MLQQILSDMFIDPDLLEELPEEQKQFLFFKMREEQVRRWKIREEEILKEEETHERSSKRKNNKKNVEFIKGSDGNDWVWVMGEHENDKSIEQILEEEAEAKAMEIAEREIQKEMSIEKEKKKMKELEEERLKALEEEQRLDMLEDVGVRKQSESEREQDLPQIESVETIKEIDGNVMEKNPNQDNVKDCTANEIEVAEVETSAQSEKENITRTENEVDKVMDVVNVPQKSTEGSVEDVLISNITSTRKEKSKRKRSLDDSSKEKKGNGEKNPDRCNGVQLRRTSRGSNNDEDDRLRKMIMRRSREILFDFKSIRARFEEIAKKDGKELKRYWKVQEKKSKAAEEEIKQASLRVREAHRSSFNEMMTFQLIQAKPSISPEEATKVRRRDITPEPAPRKSKPRPLPSLPDGETDPPLTYPKPPVPPRPRVTRRPANRQAAINWFHKHQKPRAAVIDPDSFSVAPWFHGLITRATAETILEECSTGTFLLRISDRLFGYAVSVRGEHRCKHFLVEAMPQGGYRLFGLGQHKVHQSLHQFINFHKDTPLSVFGNELLVEPVNQTTIPKEEYDSTLIIATQTELFPEIPTEDVVTNF